MHLLISWVPSLTKFILVLSRLMIGFCFASLIIAQSVVNHYFRRDSDQVWVQLWYGLGSIGDALGIVLGEVLLGFVEMDFRWATTCGLLFYGLCSLFMWLSTDEIPINVSQISSSQEYFQKTH